jgi:hypothetical protein
MRTIVAAAVLCTVALPAVAQAWQPAERACGAAIEQQYGCTTACTNKLWPLIARCTVQRTYGHRISAARLDACMKPIWDRRWEQQTCELCGDPVGEAIRCAGG